MKNWIKRKGRVYFCKECADEIAELKQAIQEQTDKLKAQRIETVLLKIGERKLVPIVEETYDHLLKAWEFDLIQHVFDFPAEKHVLRRLNGDVHSTHHIWKQEYIAQEPAIMEWLLKNGYYK